MSESLATATAAPVDGYPVYDFRALGEFQSKMPNLTNLERATAHMLDVVDFTKSPAGMAVYEAWAKKPLPVNPMDAAALMKRIEQRFLALGRPNQETVQAEKSTSGQTGDAAPLSSDGPSTATHGQ